MFANHSYSEGATVNLSKQLSRGGIITPIGQYLVQDFKFENNTNIEIVQINDMWVSSNNMQYITLVSDSDSDSDISSTIFTRGIYIIVTDPNDIWFNIHGEVVKISDDPTLIINGQTVPVGSILVKFFRGGSGSSTFYRTDQIEIAPNQTLSNRWGLTVGHWIYLYQRNLTYDRDNPNPWFVERPANSGNQYRQDSQRWYLIEGFGLSDRTTSTQVVQEMGHYIILRDPIANTTFSILEWTLGSRSLPERYFITSTERGTDWQIEYPSDSDGYVHNSTFKRWYIQGGNLYDNYWNSNYNPDHPNHIYSSQLIFGKTSYVLFYNPNTQLAKYYIRFSEITLANLQFEYRPQYMFPMLRHRYNNDINGTKDGIVYSSSNVNFQQWYYYLKSYKFNLCLSDGELYTSGLSYTNKIDLTLSDLDKSSQTWADQELVFTYPNTLESNLDSIDLPTSEESLQFQTTWAVSEPIIGVDPANQYVYFQYYNDFNSTSVHVGSILQ